MPRREIDIFINLFTGPPYHTAQRLGTFTSWPYAFVTVADVLQVQLVNVRRPKSPTLLGMLSSKRSSHQRAARAKYLAQHVDAK